MLRRGILGAGAATGLLSSAALGQTSTRVPRVGYLSANSAPDPDLEALRAGLRRLGHVEGRSYVLEARYAEGDRERLVPLLDELLRSGVRVLALGGPAGQMAIRASQHVPVAFVMSGDPVDAGIVASYARPGGNVTGISLMALDLVPKRLSLLKEAAPSIRRVGVISNPQHAGERNELRVTQEAAQALGMEIVYEKVRTAAEREDAFESFRRARCDAINAFPEAVTSSVAREIASFANANAMPSVFGWRNFCTAGGLMSYGPIRQESFQRVAYFVDRMIAGAKPADLPVELPQAIELVINQATAKRLGLTLPHVLLSRADEVIE
jgi:putative ABC transport system substrate-binding protein